MGYFVSCLMHDLYYMKMNLSLFQVLIALDIVGFTRSDCPSHTHTHTHTHARTVLEDEGWGLPQN